MDDFEHLSQHVRHELSRLYRDGEITKKQLMEQMKNGWFDHERMKIKEKFLKWIKKDTPS
ncbi:hypothetical protein SAMN04487866_10125 [Thermoactinomyces sp. DSM 45891]|uniref:hypothetical protein n=1 Tax=Thermoactinomyces sp. DSM 45891 TaxID=1761907 RepID=UPI000922BEAF|nr:hypothetical protein [Thermoactinomyces sp. DSM 45891]SFW97980.1 hypothetical protein SAMN04487866_10125 [Thermoactinomyces sp. DSM 45891]